MAKQSQLDKALAALRGMQQRPTNKPTIEPVLLRTREAALMLSVSETQIGIWTRAGVLSPIRIPGIRAVRYAREDVEALARSWRVEVQAAR